METPRIGRRHPVWAPEMGEFAAFEWQGPEPLFVACVELETGDERRFKKAAPRLALVRQGPAIVLAVEWKDWATLAAPFHAAMAAARDLPEDARPVLPPAVPPQGLRLTLHLVDAATGRFAAERPLALSRPFAESLLAEARRQIAEGIDQDAYAAAVDAFYDELEDPDDLFKAGVATDKPRAWGAA